VELEVLDPFMEGFEAAPREVGAREQADENQLLDDRHRSPCGRACLRRTEALLISQLTIVHASRDLCQEHRHNRRQMQGVAACGGVRARA